MKQKAALRSRHACFLLPSRHERFMRCSCAAAAVGKRPALRCRRVRLVAPGEEAGKQPPSRCLHQRRRRRCLRVRASHCRPAACSRTALAQRCSQPPPSSPISSPPPKSVRRALPACRSACCSCILVSSCVEGKAEGR